MGSPEKAPTMMTTTIPTMTTLTRSSGTENSAPMESLPSSLQTHQKSQRSSKLSSRSTKGKTSAPPPPQESRPQQRPLENETKSQGESHPAGPASCQRAFPGNKSVPSAGKSGKT